jgi:hypothetical protein
MYIMKNSSASNVIRILISFLIFFSTIVIVNVAINIPQQSDAKKKITVTTPISLAPSSNTVLNNQNTGTGGMGTSSANITNAQQEVDNSTNSTNNSSYSIYENAADRISIMYPSNWQKIEYPAGAMGYGVGHRIIANFLAPLNSSDQWRGSLTIQISSQSDLKNIVPQNVTANTTNLASHRAFKLEYTNNERIYRNSNLTNFNTIALKVMQVWTTIGDNTYLLTYNAETSKYPQYLPIIQKMLNSFKVS